MVGSIFGRLRVSAWALIGAAALAMTACGGGDDDAPPTGGGGTAKATLTGVAAVGAPITNATVTVVNVRGETASASTTASGGFTVEINEGAPYGLRVTDGAGNTWYSYAQAAGRANITPLTTLAMADAWGYKPLADLVAAWQANAPTAEQVLAAAAKVNANLQATIQAQGLNPAALNVFTAEFSANGQGLDAVLDAMRVRFDCSATSCSQTITAPGGGVLITWNAAINTTGFTLSWSGSGGTGGGQVNVNLGACSASPAAGSWSMLVQTLISGIAAPEVCVDGLPAKPGSRDEFCGGTDVVGALPPGVEILSCSYDGSTGEIAARVTTPIVIHYTVKYTFVQR